MRAYLIRPLQRYNPAWSQWQLDVTGFLEQGGYLVFAEDPETARHQAIFHFSHGKQEDDTLDDPRHPFLNPELAEVIEITGHSDR